MNDDKKSIDEQSTEVSGKFRNVKLPPIRLSGRYRGRGSLQLTTEGVQISGRHVFSLGTRWAIGLGIFFGSLILTLAATGGVGYCAPGFIPLYFLVNYFLLKREEILVPYSDITQLAVDSKNSIIGIDFKGHPQCSPVFMETSSWDTLLAAFQQKIPAVEASKIQTKRKSILLIVILIIFIAIIIIGILAALAIPNLMVAKQKAMQKNAMMDIKNISSALSGYIIDNPEPPIGNWTLDFDSALYQALVPFYSTSLPVKDPWGNAYQIHFGEACSGIYGLSTDDIGAYDFLVISYGRDGFIDSWFYESNDPEAGLYSGLSMNDSNNDLVVWNGHWIRCPQ